MITTLSQKEFISALRDKRFVILVSIVIALLVLAASTGIMSYNQVAAERQIAQQTANEDFRDQPPRHPHRMAHYGSYAFRPKSSLSFFDFGLDSFTGTMVYLEAHQQNSANFSSVQQSSGLMRFGEMTIAFVLQLLIPLIIIFLCFNTFTQEKEQETIKLLLSQGLSVSQIANAKLKGYGKLLLLIMVPSLLTASLFLLLANSLSANADFWLRLLLFTGVYALYFFIFLAGSILVSAWSRHSRTALLTLLGIWITACVIMPKVTANLGSLLYQTPTKAEMDAHVHHAASKGINGHNPQDKRTEEFTKSLLQKYGVDSVSQLPVNIDGLVMAEGEAYSSKVYAQEFDELAQTYGQQNAVSKWASFINPFLSVRYISMGLAGTDQQHYIHFLKAAEDYRYRLAQHLNKLQATKLHYHDKETRLDASNWKNYPPFEYRQPSVSFALRAHWISFAALLLWGFVLYLVFNTLLNRYFPL